MRSSRMGSCCQEAPTRLCDLEQAPANITSKGLRSAMICQAARPPYTLCDDSEKSLRTAVARDGLRKLP